MSRADPIRVTPLATSLACVGRQLPTLESVEARIKRDNGGVYNSARDARYVVTIRSDHTPGTILAELVKRRRTHPRALVIYCYSRNTCVQVDRGYVYGAMNIHHIDDNPGNDDPRNLALCPFIFNVMLTSKALSNRISRFGKPLYSTFIDCRPYFNKYTGRPTSNRGNSTGKNPEEGRYRDFWKCESLRATPEGKKLVDLGYDEQKKPLQRKKMPVYGLALRNLRAEAVLAFFRAHWRRCFPEWQNYPTLDLEFIFSDIERRMGLTPPAVAAPPTVVVAKPFATGVITAEDAKRAAAYERPAPPLLTTEKVPIARDPDAVELQSEETPLPPPPPAPSVAAQVPDVTWEDFWSESRRIWDGDLVHAPASKALLEIMGEKTEDKND